MEITCFHYAIGSVPSCLILHVIELPQLFPMNVPLLVGWQNVTEANAQNATMARMNEAAASAPQTDDEVLAKLRDGKEDQ
ncbi:hypothetical protein AL01_01060 [Bombella intestini]|uniref:Uncharacterized protein n=1 Tax=Bombella intestini TaxID=1539051 RepID=A0A1S8GRD6_9PROT|nr:hypothetical protein [Bombella intestini]OOL19603.1 hypothetical protein AL01_01060 [Bombella intestini]